MQDFENEDSYLPDCTVHQSNSGATDFSMYPPVENTPDPISASPVIFEPLPDLNKLRPSNAVILRPRVGMLSPKLRERSYSDDSLDDIVEPDPIQDKLRLQTIMCKFLFSIIIVTLMCRKYKVFSIIYCICI